MPERTLKDLINRLHDLDEEGAAWRPFENAMPELRERLADLDAQWRRLPAPLVVVLVGGTGVGKSTLLNALAGSAIATCGDERPTTETPTVYLPPGAARPFGPADYVESPALHELVLIDTPDTDSIKTEHRALVETLLSHADVILFCATQEKYKDEKSLRLLRPIRGERTIVCVQTHADEEQDIREDWLNTLEQEGFAVESCFRISATAAFARAGDGFEFADLERYLKEKLPPERRSIKERNLAGAIQGTLDTLDAQLEGKDADLNALHERLAGLELEIADSTLAELRRRVLDAPPVWITALADAVSERAFGLVGTLYRVLHWTRMAPGKIIGSLSPAGLLRSATARGDATGVSAKWAGASEDFLGVLADRFGKEHAEASAYLARSGFHAPGFADWKDNYIGELRRRLDTYLSPLQQRLERWARALSYGLALLELAWLAPFLITVGGPIIRHYWNTFAHWQQGVPPEGFYLEQTLALFATVIFVELIFFTYLVRSAGRRLRKRCLRDIEGGLKDAGFGFEKERAEIQLIIEQIQTVASLRRESENL
ncbi:MAG TPA: GTPase domain-containing protein [Candidatus Bathyarchaeia archaeon]|nr:GTPase domain-containing protein [Candidatus Bathyarchaeia archaeon]